MCRRWWTQRAGYPAGFTLPQCTKRTRWWRARPAARRDQNRTAGRVLVRRTPIGRRSTTAGNPASTSNASGSAGVETTRSPRGNRFASSPCNRAMPPPIGGKSCAKSSVVIETNLRSRSAEFPVDPDQIGRDPVPIVVALDRGATGGAQAAAQRFIFEHAQDRRGHRGRILRIDEQSGFALADGLGNAPGAATDHRQAARGRLHARDPESLHQQVVAPGSQHEQVGGVVQRGQVFVGNEAEETYGVAQTELGHERFERGAPAPAPGDGVACPRNGGPDGGERPDDRVDPLVEVETGDGEDPRASVEPIGAPGGPGVNAGTEMGGRRAEVHDPDVGGEGVAAEGLEHGAGQIRGPAAVGDDHGAALEDSPRRPALEARASDLRLEQQEVRAVGQYAERQAAARGEPGGRVPRRLDLVAPGEARVRPARQRGGAPGPAEEPVQGAQPLRADGHAVDRLVEARVTGLAARPGSGRHEQAVGWIAASHLAHHAGDAAAERREVEREEESRLQRRRRATASPYTPSGRSAARSSVNSRRTRARPARAIRCASSRSPSTRSSAAAHAPGSRGGTSRPVSPDVMTSGLPPASDATAGSPSAMVSSSAIESPPMRDGRAETVARRQKARGRSVNGTYTTRWRSGTRRSIARSSGSASMPTHATTTGRCKAVS